MSRGYDDDYDGWEEDHTYDPENPPAWDRVDEDDEGDD